MARMKLKSHSGAAKRFKRTGTGKFMRRKAGLRHILTTKNANGKVVWAIRWLSRNRIGPRWPDSYPIPDFLNIRHRVERHFSRTGRYNMAAKQVLREGDMFTILKTKEL